MGVRGDFIKIFDSIGVIVNDVLNVKSVNDVLNVVI